MNRLDNLTATALRFSLVSAMGFSAAWAQAPAAPELPVDRGLRADRTYTDVYLNDSFQATDAIATARSLAQNRQWRQAAEQLQRTLRDVGDKLVRTSPGYYVGIREHVHGLIANWPRVGIDAYQSLFDAEITEALAKLGTNRGIDDLLPLFEQYFCTTTAADLADTIAQVAIEGGDLALARSLYERVLKHHPDAERYSRRYRAMVALVDALDENINRSEDVDLPLVDPAVKIRWMGQDRAIGDVLKTVRAVGFQTESTPSLRNWPIFGGDSTRNRRTKCEVDELGLLWHFRGFAGGGGDETNDGSDSSGSDGDREAARRLSSHPVVNNGLVFAQRFREIVAIHRNTGVAAWRFRADIGATAGFSLFDEEVMGWDSVTAHGGRIYASLAGDAIPYYSYESARSPPELVCLDAKTGRLIWRVDDQTVGDSFAEVAFDSSPLVSHGRLFVVGRRRRSFGFEDCYVYRFDARTGALEHRTHIGSASTGTFGSRRPTRSIAALHGDRIYVCTNLGTVAAVSTHSGAVDWLRLYERVRADADRGSDRYSRQLHSWSFNPVIWTPERLIVFPIDSAQVLVLSPEDGSLLASIPTDRMGGVQTILGIRGDLLCGVGAQVSCYNLAMGRLQWSEDLNEGESLFGRGIWADDSLYIPSRRALSTFAVDSGEMTRVPWEVDIEGGNLLVLPDQVLVANGHGLTALVRRTQIWKSLRERMAASPHDPLPALELAEVACSSGHFEEALAALDDALHRAGRENESLLLELGQRIFDDVLLLVDRLEVKSKLDSTLIAKLFSHAAQSAPDASANVRYRLRFARIYSSFNEPKRELRLYQQILRDRSLRNLSAEELTPSHPTAGAYAESKVAALLTEHGLALYAPYEEEARRWLSRGQDEQDESLLTRVVSTFPNSAAAPQALVAQGDLLVSRGRAPEGAKRFAAAYHRYAHKIDRPDLLRKIADTYEQAGKPEDAYRWLTRALREYPGVHFEHLNRQVSFHQYRERLADVRERVEPSRPQITLPLSKHDRVDFEDNVTLLIPRYGTSPTSTWSSYFVQTPKGIVSFAAGNGARLWPRPVPVKGSVECLVSRVDVAVFATAHQLFGVRSSSGELAWSFGDAPGHLDAGLEDEFRVDGDWEDDDPFRAHAIYGNRLVGVKESGSMLCVDIASGTLIWSQRHRPVPRDGIRLSQRWLTYYVTQDDPAVTRSGPRICLVDASTGAWVHAISTDESRAVAGVYITFDDHIILATVDAISSYDPETKVRRWRTVLDGRLRPGSLLTDLDAIYYSDDGHRVRKISLDNGQLLWESERLIPRGDDDLTAELYDTNLIVSSISSVTAVDAVSGLTLWRGTGPEHPRFSSRLLTNAYVAAVHLPVEVLEEPSVAYFYDHRNASGIIARNGGALQLGLLPDTQAVLIVDQALLLQVGSSIHRYGAK